VLHRGVYAVGHRVLRPQAYRLAAARACGEGAAVSFAAAAAQGAAKLARVWPGVPFAIEVDGWAFHRGRRPFERDRERDAILAAAGIFTLRFTDLQLARRPQEVESALTIAASR